MTINAPMRDWFRYGTETMLCRRIGLYLKHQPWGTSDWLTMWNCDNCGRKLYGYEERQAFCNCKEYQVNTIE